MTTFKNTEDTFNARYLSNEQVAKTFIANHQYMKLLKNNHSLLMGPRGCGKTTLLKMLSPSAIYFWQDEFANGLIENLPFWSIYIPADIQWKCELDKLNVTDRKQISFNLLLSKELVIVNILVAILDTFEQLIRIFVKDSEEQDNLESLISKHLVSIWRIEGIVPPTFFSLNEEILKRVDDINQISDDIIFRERNVKDISLPKYFGKDIFNIIRLSCNTFEHYFFITQSRNPKKIKWALCFDELEIAPEWLQKKLLTLLQSTDQKFLFKLTTSPLISIYNKISKQGFKISAAQNDDYEIIRNWVYDNNSKTKWNKFCHELVSARLYRKYGFNVTPERIFQKYNIDLAIYNEDKKRFADCLKKKNNEPGSALYILLKDMAQEDSSLYNYLIRKKINPLNPIVNNPKLEDEVIRKIKPLIVCRYFLRKNTKDKLLSQKILGSQGRSRKIVKIHFGIKYIYEICDGNPRALITLIDNLLANSWIKNDRIVEIPISYQSEKIIEYSESFLLKISNHPDSTILDGNTEWNLGNIINIIGNYFSDRVNGKNFSADPHLSFRITENTNPTILELLKLALNLGVIQYLEPKKEYTDRNMERKRFRLSYTLYPYFNLPKQEFKSIEIEKIFEHNKNGKMNNQLSFMEDENENSSD